MAQATFRSGSPVMVDYTPGADVTAGDVVVLVSIAANTTGAGLCCGVAHLDIANGVLGALAAGDGVYDVINLDNAANGAKVYWDDSVDKVTTTSTNNGLYGFVVSGGAGGANTICQCLHQPYV